MASKKQLLAGALALATCANLVTVGAFAGQGARSTSTQTSSAEETVYVNNYGGSQRRVDFTNHWRFNLGSGSEAVDYNDSSWKNVDLPHDYSIEQEYSKNGEAESGYLPGGTGWYRKTFSVSEDWKNKVITVDFGGVYMNATVYLNGHKLGFHPYGYTAFSFELPQEYLKYDGENVLAVKVEHQTPSSRWYSGSGIYRNVSLTVTDPVHVAQHGTYVTTPNLDKEHPADGTTRIVTTVDNDSKESATVKVKQSIYKRGTEDVVATHTEESVTVEAGKTKDVTQTLTVENPALWDTNNPNLYVVKTEIEQNGKVVDTYTTEYGYRWLTFNNDSTGFELNGVPTKLKGVCMHHDQGPLGSEAWYRAMERQVEILKDMGANAIRVTHNPASPELIEIANRKGIMIVDEAFDTWTNPKNGNVNDYSKWFNQTVGQENKILGGRPDMTWAEYDMKAMVYQDRNAPSVIMYSLGNEIFEGISGNASNYPSIAQKLIDWGKQVDNTRPPTFGDNKLKGGHGTAGEVAKVVAKNGGIVGYNYSNEGVLKSGIQKGWKVYHSETASAVNSRGVYDRKNSNGDGGRGDRLLTSYDKSAVGWGNVASEAWWRTVREDASMGEFVWTGFDYIGEPTPWNGVGPGPAGGSWPAPKSSYFGIIDTNGLPKDSYYLYQSLWNDDVTTAHILPTWNERDVMKDSSGKVEVVVYSDAAKIELYLNDSKVGEATSKLNTTTAGYKYRTWQDKNNNHTGLYATFQVPYQAGKLEVKAYDQDNHLIENTKGRSVVQTTGNAANLTLSADRREITADGDDLSYITIDVKDAQGNLVNTNDVEVKLSITGEGKIIGVDNGRQIDHTSYQSLNHKAAAGQLVAVVQSTEKAGSFTVKAESNGLTAGEVKVTTKEAPHQGEQDSIASYDISRHYYVKVGNRPTLPGKVVASYRNGETRELKVTWDSYDDGLINKVGTFVVTGTLEGTHTKVSVNVTMLDQVSHLLNYSVAVPRGGEVNLPGSRPAVLEDGTVLNAEFPVEWKMTKGITDEVGTKIIQGTSTVFGEKIDVTASVRVADGTVTIGANVAKNAAQLTQDIGSNTPSDTLEAIRDGKTAASANTSGGANPTTWSNYNAAQAGRKDASLTFRYDTAQSLGEVDLYFYTDTYSAAIPSNVKMEWSDNGEQWNALEIRAGEQSTPHNNVTRVPYTFTPQDAVFFRITVSNKEGKPTSGAKSYCVALSEVELKLAQTSFPINNSDALTGITVNGQAWTQSQLDARTYSTEALLVDTLEITNGNNVAYTKLPAHNNVMKILTESEDHTKRGVYTIELGAAPSAGDPADGSRDYDRNKTTPTAASAQGQSGNEGPVTYATDDKANTFWHTKWNEDLRNQPDKRYIQLKLEEPTSLDALRYLPRPNKGNGMVTKYEVKVSDSENGEWKKVAEGTWDQSIGWKLAAFDKPVTAQYIRLYGVETRGGNGDQPNQFMSAAEVRVRKAEPKTDLSQAKVTLEKDTYDFTGQAIEPKVTSVVLGDKTLKYGLDYAVSFSNNVNPGTGTVTVRGIMGYTGTVSKTFTIQAAGLEVDKVENVSLVTPQGTIPQLPGTVKVTFTNGSSMDCNVAWGSITEEQVAQVGDVFTVKGQVTLPENKTAEATATIRVITKNLALKQEGSTLPLAVSFYSAEYDSAANINDGNKSFDVSQNKKVWSDWERDVFHEAPWVGIVLKEATTVDRISIGFIDELASSDPNVNAGSKVRLPASYEIQAYVGTDELDYKTDNVNDGRNWPVMNNQDNWKTVATVTELPASKDYAQMLETTFDPVKTTAIRVVMKPQANQWVGVDELEIYGSGETAPQTHTVTVKTEGEGTAAANPTAAQAGATITLTQNAAEGWHFKEWRSEDVTVTGNTFAMPDADVTITAVFEKNETPEPTPTPTPEPTPEPTEKPQPTPEPTDPVVPSEPGNSPAPTEPGANPTDKPDGNGPAQTGDKANLTPIVVVLVVAAVALVVVVVVNHKRKR